MPRLYLDQDALIRIGRNGPDSAEVSRRIADGRFTLVLSTAHWLDTAGGDSDDNSRQLARFIDTLRPIWLRERVDVFGLECRGFLQGIPFEQLREQVICRTVSELMAQIGGLVSGGAAIVESEQVVMELRHNEKSKRIFETSYAKQGRAAKRNRELFRAGKITPGIHQKAHDEALRLFGKVAGESSEHIRLREAPPQALRALTCEFEATSSYWRQSAAMTPSRIRDLFHLVVAMPYTDFIVTYDQNLYRTISDVATRVCFPVAKAVTSTEKLIEAAR